MEARVSGFSRFISRKDRRPHSMRYDIFCTWGTEIIKIKKKV
jgi:hypothetical protein